jgi:hypothetical protein
LASSEAATPPAAGSCIATTIVLAAGLAELTASVAGAADVVERARDLQSRAAPLGAEDAHAYEAFLRDPSPANKQRTVDLPAQMAELAAEAAELAAEATERARGAVAGDAATGALLAETAARAAALLVRINGGGDGAEEPAERASAAARRALGSF